MCVGCVSDVCRMGWMRCACVLSVSCTVNVVSVVFLIYIYVVGWWPVKRASTSRFAKSSEMFSRIRFACSI